MSNLVIAITFFATAPDARVELLAFHAEWCAPCRRMQPVLEELQRDGYTVRHIDIDQSPAEARRWNVTAVPTCIAVRDGRELARTVGLTTAARLRALFPPARRQAATPADAAVRVVVADRSERWLGSGVVVVSDDHEAIVLTAAHVVRRWVQAARAPASNPPTARLYVEWPDGRRPARVAYANFPRDIAVLRVATSGPVATAELADELPPAGASVSTVGYPHGAGPVALHGRLVSVGRWDGYLEATMRTRLGHSGGGLFHQGRLAGILWGCDGTSLYVPLDELRGALREAGVHLQDAQGSGVGGQTGIGEQGRRWQATPPTPIPVRPLTPDPSDC